MCQLNENLIPAMNENEMYLWTAGIMHFTDESLWKSTIITRLTVYNDDSLGLIDYTAVVDWVRRP